MRKINGNKLMFLAVVLSIAITVMYSRSITILYGATELLIAGFCYLLILKNWRKMDSYLLLIVLVLTGFSFINGVVRAEIKSVVLLSISLVLPLGVSVLPIECSDDKRAFRSALLFGLVMCTLQQYWNVFGYINSNTLGFMSYMCISVGYVWFLCSKNRLVPILCLLFGMSISLSTGSRNVAIVTAIALILLLLPKRLYTKKAFFRVLYLLVLVYTICAATIMEWGFNNEFISNLLTDYTEKYSEKAWEMAARVDYLRQIRARISGMNITTKLFGEGILMRHGHNMFYQSVFIYGYIGTVAVYAFYIRIFEMARQLIGRNQDKVVLGCTIALIGCFMLNGADVFIIGSETCAIIPQVLMGIIIYRYRAMMHPSERLNESVETHESA